MQQPHNVSDVGQGKTYNDAVEKYDKEAGRHSDNVAPVPTDDRLPTAQMPKGTDPNPFTLGPMTSGGR